MAHSDVEKGWKGAQEEQEFLREIFVGACQHFTTVLAPGSDIYHYNHFHLDLARHDPRGRRRVCKPLIKFEPRLDPNRTTDAPAPRPRPAIRPLPQPAEPLEIEEEGDDPYAASAGPSRSGPAPQARVAASAPPPPVSALRPTRWRRCDQPLRHRLPAAARDSSTEPHRRAPIATATRRRRRLRAARPVRRSYCNRSSTAARRSTD
jgi:hypothetical protein